MCPHRWWREGLGDSRASEIGGLNSVWNQLSGTTFMTWEWLTARWSAYGKAGELSPLLLHPVSLRFSWLEWNRRILACHYRFVSGNTHLHLQEEIRTCLGTLERLHRRARMSVRELLQQGSPNTTLWRKSRATNSTGARKSTRAVVPSCPSGR
jgi:hypothetical protein